jgi:hypothetical protein
MKIAVNGRLRRVQLFGKFGHGAFYKKHASIIEFPHDRLFFFGIETSCRRVELCNGSLDRLVDQIGDG